MYTQSNANVHRAIYDLGSKATEQYENSRTKVTNFINAPSEKEVIFTKGTTESINLLGNTIGSSLKPGDEILITEMEHHANIVPWQMACERTGAQLNYIPIDKNGELDLSNPDKLFSKATKIISVTHVFQCSWDHQSHKKLSKIAKSLGAIFVVDGAQGVPPPASRCPDLSCDFFYAFSGHKMLGPTGVGAVG